MTLQVNGNATHPVAEACGRRWKTRRRNWWAPDMLRLSQALAGGGPQTRRQRAPKLVLASVFPYSPRTTCCGSGFHRAASIRPRRTPDRRAAAAHRGDTCRPKVIDATASASHEPARCRGARHRSHRPRPSRTSGEACRRRCAWHHRSLRGEQSETLKGPDQGACSRPACGSTIRRLAARQRAFIASLRAISTRRVEILARPRSQMPRLPPVFIDSTPTSRGAAMPIGFLTQMVALGPASPGIDIKATSRPRLSHRHLSPGRS